MSKPIRAFRHITPHELVWQTHLGVGDPTYVELFWLDASLDNGWHLGIGLYRARPYDEGRPAITLNLLRPGEPFIEVHRTFDEQAFTPLPFGGRWGSDNAMLGELTEQGRPRTVRLSLDVERIQLDLTCQVVCTGVKFTTASPGFTHHREETGTAVGWWPVAPRADVVGSVVLDGESTAVRGRVHLEKQLSSLPLAGEEGAASAQSMWTWGHFSSGEYTGIWTDSGASAHLGYRHFTPFVLYHGDQVVLSTFAAASYVERFCVEPSSGLPRPEVVTLKAAEGEREFFARLVDGRVVDQFELDGTKGAYYCRQLGTVEAELRHWGETTRFEGEAVHEWGTKAGNLPF